MKVALTVADFLDRAEAVYPERLAVVDEPGRPGSFGRLTYREVAARARGMALALDRLGVPAGERVAIVSPNCARFLISFYGVSGYGRVLVPINYRLTAAEVSYIVEHSGASVLLVDPELDDVLSGVKAKERIVLDGVADAELFAEAAPGATPVAWEPDEDAVCTINYTSGTTARPKGVRLTHRNNWLNAVSFGWHTTVTDRDVILHTLPMFHVNGWGMPFAVTGMGGTHVAIRKIDGEDILSRVEREGVTLLCGAPAVVASILDAAAARLEAGQPVPGRDTVRIVVAGAPPPSAVVARVEELLGWEFIQIYGLTEAAPLLTINRSRAEWDGLAVDERSRLLAQAGVPALGVRLRLDPSGEVMARSNHVFDGYWEQPEQTALAIEDGWFHTGDGGTLDGATLAITDRKKDVIITGGENVSSIEVEDCLYLHKSVAEAAVIGVPDPKWGETVKALVVLRPGERVEPAELIAFCRDRMAHYKCPTSVELRDALERTATGKLQKFKLRAPYWEGRDRAVN
ncbi:AMP-binding protein [Pseudofrankia inefficax]|uniref:AMP-dependent synthetase and ligase n=1 Tax=Pseudofrankia inefficax (strain DSM 45817 / CECT 9037 / DDB 130130 / EuI1c) TaxID=298654 RepID=E3J899_PSEI1|nr:AMP-binding protein [Pseudofrankia inefficax]ADP83292.1 AMP-dependent synthetase and ligase [Pseudofrankia inefficax]